MNSPENYLELDQWIQLESIGSTNDYLMQGSQPPGTVVTARKQTAGKGRSGRSWRMGEGDALYFSGLFQWKDSPPRPMFSLAMGLAVLDALRFWPGRPSESKDLHLKCPNDLVRKDANGLQKLGGLLIEGRQQAGKWQTVVGIGINWSTAPEYSEGDALKPGCILERGQTEPGAMDFVPVLVENLNARAASYFLDATRNQFVEADILQNRVVRLDDSTVRVRGITEAGELILDNGSTIGDSSRSLSIVWDD